MPLVCLPLQRHVHMTARGAPCASSASSARPPGRPPAPTHLLPQPLHQRAGLVDGLGQAALHGKPPNAARHMLEQCTTKLRGRACVCGAD